MVKKLKLKTNTRVQDVKVSMCSDLIFLFTNSISDGSVPQIGDELIDVSKKKHFLIKSICPLISGKSELDNYALKVEIIK